MCPHYDVQTFKVENNQKYEKERITLYITKLFNNLSLLEIVSVKVVFLRPTNQFGLNLTFKSVKSIDSKKG